MRSSRAESLVLVGDDGTRRELFTQHRDAGELATQEVFQVSPDGAHLAYAFEDTLHVRASDGSEHTIAGYHQGASHMRFSPDGKYLAAILANTAEHRIVLLDLATGALRELGVFTVVMGIEWSQHRLIAATWDLDRHLAVLFAFPSDGSATRIAEVVSYDRFIAAPDASRVIVVARDASSSRVVAFDADAPSKLRELAKLDGRIENLAISRDGSRVAFATAAGVFETRGDARARSISARSFVTSLWYSRDGSLGYASTSSATVLSDGGRARHFDSDGPIAMLRFDAVSGHALVATRAHAWDLATSQRFAAPGAGQALVGVDRFAGGLVLWTAAASN